MWIDELLLAHELICYSLKILNITQGLTSSFHQIIFNYVLGYQRKTIKVGQGIIYIIRNMLY